MDFSSINNYYEHLVIDYMRLHVIPNHSDQSPDFFLDIACYALSKLPARYMRHEIDMAFYMSVDERVRMTEEVKKQVDHAVEYISKNFNRDDRYGANQ